MWEVTEEGFNEREFGDMSDEELQEAFAAGLLKPGLNVPVEKKIFKNNVEGLKLKLKEFKKDLKWIERLDLQVKPAPMAPELHYELNENEKNKIPKLKTVLKTPSRKDGDSVALDDLKREMLFHRQAQSAVIEGISRLNSLRVPTQRPDDYFAEMAKSDKHMHKVRESLAAKQAGALKAERISQLRKLKALGKQTQIENKLKQQKEKKKMLTEVKKYRKGLRKDLNFLDDKQNKKKGSGKMSKKRVVKNEKFGFGGKKRGMKSNSHESSASFGGPSKGKKNQFGGGKQKRLGKSRRIQKRNRK